MVPHIKIQSFTSTSIKTYIPSIAKVRVEVFHEYPFLYPTNVEKEKQKLKKFSRSKESITVIVFDGAKIVGVSSGLPLQEEAEEIRSLFLQNGLLPHEYYCLGDSLLDKSYRGRGVGHHFFDIREAHVRHLKKFKYSCFFMFSPPFSKENGSADYSYLEEFWKKRGYTPHPQLSFTRSWVDVDGSKATEKKYVFWIKKL